MSCTGRQSVNPNGCCKSGIVGTRCNPNKYWSSPAAGGGEGDVVTRVASITLVKVACCVGPCRHDIRWVVLPPAVSVPVWYPEDHLLVVVWLRKATIWIILEEKWCMSFYPLLKCFLVLGTIKQGCPILSGGPTSCRVKLHIVPTYLPGSF